MFRTTLLSVVLLLVLTPVCVVEKAGALESESDRALSDGRFIRHVPISIPGQKPQDVAQNGQSACLSDKEIQDLACALYLGKPLPDSSGHNGWCGAPLAMHIEFALQAASPRTKEEILRIQIESVKHLGEMLDEAYQTENFRIQYTRQGDAAVYRDPRDIAGQAPTYIQNLGMFLEDSLARYHSYGFRSPLSAGSKIDVVVTNSLLNTPLCYLGLTGSLTLFQIYIDNDMRIDDTCPKRPTACELSEDCKPKYPDPVYDLLKVVAAHELFHKVQFNYFWRDPVDIFGKKPFFSEGMATLMEDAIYDDVSHYIGHLNLYLW